MASLSKNKYDVQRWIYKCINSCKTVSQLVACNKLRKNYTDLYKLSSDEFQSFIFTYNVYFDMKIELLIKENKRK